MQPNPEFEADVRAAMAVPEPDPAFLRSLRGQLIRPSASREARATRIAWVGLAASVLFLLAVIWIVGPETVLAEFRSLLGYVPEIGLVQNDASLRILAELVKIERDGITVQVLQGATDPQHTVLVFQVDGIPQSARPASEDAPGCPSQVTLQTADGSQLQITGGGGNVWGTGYETRATFPALPAGSSSATLIIPCLADTRPGAAPENWQIPLAFKPAPADMKVFPVYDLAGATPTQVQPTLLAAATAASESEQVLSNAATVEGIRISLDQAVETETGFLLKGSISKDPQTMLDVRPGRGTQLLDARGAVIPTEYHSAGGSLQDPSSAWELQTNSKAYPGPWKLSIPEVIIELSGYVPFEIDLGPTPRIGQTWELNKSIDFAGYELVVQKVEMTQGPGQTTYLDFTFGGSSGLFSASVTDPDNSSARTNGKSSSAESGAITSAFSYDQLPTGKRKIVVDSLTYIQKGPWNLGWQPPATSAGAATTSPESEQVLSNAATVAGIRLSLDQVMETENGFVLQGSTSWKGMENTIDVGVGLGMGTSLLDGHGTVIPIEHYTDQKRGSLEPQSNTWAFQTNNKAYPGPWTMRIPAVIVQMTSHESFEIDLGSMPKPGQTFDLNASLAIAGHTLVVQKAELTHGLDGSYFLDFTFGGDPDLFDVSISDPDNKSALLSGKGRSAESGSITSAISYDYLPTGKRTILVTSLSYVQQGPWNLGWQPPATSAGAATPTAMPQACLTEEKWQQFRSQAPSELPPGVSGQILVEQSIGQLMPQISLVNLATGQTQAIAVGAMSSLSPDGSQVAYIESFGKSILIAPTDGGQPHSLAGTTESDSNPLWSPDGNWIAFTRSNDGIYIIHPDGSGLKRLTGPTLQASLVNWTPDSHGLAISVMSSAGDQLQMVDIDSGDAQTLLTIAKSKSGFRALSPDGQRITFNEEVFGKNYYSTWIANLDGSGRKLLANLDHETTVVATWSPDGKWVVLVVLEIQRDTTIKTNLLIQPETCQVTALTGISATITSWR